MRLIEALQQAEQPLSVSEIAERLEVDQPRASKLVQWGVASGLVRREVDPDDARRTLIAATEEGTKLFAQAHRARRGAVEQALSEFSEDERAQLAELLTRLADAWPR